MQTQQTTQAAKAGLINVLAEVQAQSGLPLQQPRNAFCEALHGPREAAPPPVIQDYFELVEDSVQAVRSELKRLENRIVLLKEQVARVTGREVGK